jgi:hypothetical protein
MLIEHLGARPAIDPTADRAYGGDLRRCDGGAGPSIGFGAVLTAESGRSSSAASA